MKLRKLLAVTAVAATMTAAFAVNAMAETPNKFTNFKYEDGVITLNADADAVQIPVQSAGPYTMLVVRVDDTGLADTEIADTDIKQIDQADAPFTTINVGDLTVAVEDCKTCSAVEGKKTCTCTHTYEIRLGGDGTVRWGTLVVKGAEDDSPYENPNRLLGDTNNDGSILSGDASTILSDIAFMTNNLGTKTISEKSNPIIK